MLQNTKVCFIGGGTMGGAMIAGLTKKELIKPEDIIASDPYPGQLEKLAATYHVNTTSNNRDAVKDKDIIVLSIKPQSLAEVGAELRGSIPAKSLVLSIIAGAPIGKISQLLHHYNVVRVMPNTPALVSKAMSVWTATDEVTEHQRNQVKIILSILGEELYVDHEDYLDMATALSGTGPAYVFMFMEAMIDAGVHMGFSRRISEQLVLQTIEGSVAYARDSQRHPAELRNMVTSPGGTTAEALYQLEKGGFRTVLSKAILGQLIKNPVTWEASKTMGEFLAIVINVIFQVLWWAVLIRVLLSWLPMANVRIDPYNPAIRFLYSITDPILEPLRRFTTIGMIDLSPLVALLLLDFLRQILISMLV